MSISQITVGNKTLLEFKENNIHSFVLTSDIGYEPIIKFRDILVSEFSFQLESEYGITDITQNYTFKGENYTLKHISTEDMIVFETDSSDETNLENFRKIAATLKI